ISAWRGLTAPGALAATASVPAVCSPVASSPTGPSPAVSSSAATAPASVVSSIMRVPRQSPHGGSAVIQAHYRTHFLERGTCRFAGFLATVGDNAAHQIRVAGVLFRAATDRLQFRLHGFHHRLLAVQA